jgi:hypothetical protein
MDAPDSQECDVFEQNCPDGHKCMPISFDGAPSFNGTACRPVDPDAVEIGEPCIVQDDPYSGFDNCPDVAFCFFVDDITLEGVCIDFCRGSITDSTCVDACSRCLVSADGNTIPCVPTCDPRMQNCPAGLACQGGFGGILCRASKGDKVAGESCFESIECTPGLECEAACDGLPCCTPVCTLPDGPECDALRGTVCTEARRPSPEECNDLGDLGFCL